jgi:hypothetical protein
MKRYYSLLAVALAAAAPAGCTEPASPEDQASVDQFTFIGDLGATLGSPVAAGSTSGRSNDFAATCAPTSAPDVAYTWTAPTSDTYTFTTAGSSFDTVLEIRASGTGASLGCNDDAFIGVQSTVNVALSGGQTVTVVVDGYMTSTGNYQLNITGSGGSIPGSGMHLWLRADRDVTATGGRVSKWLDQSGSGRNASMPTASRQPFFVSNALGGLPVVRFNGAQSMNLDVVAQPTTFSVFVVGRNNMPDNSFSMILGPGGNSPNNQLRWDDGTHALFIGLGNNLPQVTPTIGNTRVYHELSAVYDGATMTVYRDGGFVSSSSFTTSGPWTLASVGSWFSTYFMQGDLAELIMYARPLSSAERASVDAYLTGKYPIP